MDIKDLLNRLYSLGIKLSVKDDKIKISTLSGEVSSEILNELKNRKDEIIKYFRGENYKDKFTSIKNIELREYYALSSAQLRLYFLQKLDAESTVYNIPISFPIPENISKEEVIKVINSILSRYENFRTSFELVEEEPVQRIHCDVKLVIEDYKIDRNEKSAFWKKFVRPFDLRQAPLLRVAYVDVKDSNNLLMIDMHHIISDASSHIILEKDIKKLFNDEKLDSVRLQYKDYSEWQNSPEYNFRLEGQKEYWLKQFANELPILNLPTDFTRPTTQSFNGATVSFVFNEEETDFVKRISYENDASFYMTMLSLFSILIIKLSGQNEIIIGTPVAGRRHIDLLKIVGMFVNTLAIHIDLNTGITFKEFLRYVKKVALEAFDNQDYQFEDLVDVLSIPRDVTRNPIFDVLFNFVNETKQTTDGLLIKNSNPKHRGSISKFDLSLTTVDYGSQFLLNFEYSTKLFKPVTIEKYFVYLKQILAQFSKNDKIVISSIDILTEEERHQLLYDFNNSSDNFSGDKSLHQLLEDQVVKTPHNVAVIIGEKSLTYKELNSRSNKLAHFLRMKGVYIDDKVGLMLEPSLEMVIAIYGILKSGAAYVPIDIDYPEKRKNHIILDSEIKVILLSDDYLENEIIKDCFNIKTIITSENHITENIKNINTPESLSYVIYTSGSTGKPKGVMVQHKNVISYLHAFNKEFKLTSDDIVLQQASLSFDTIIEELYPALNCGGKIVIIRKDEVLNTNYFQKFLLKNRITLISCSPLLLNVINEFSSSVLKYIRVFISGGDELKYTDINSLVKNAIVYNTYGPTETTVCATYYKCDSNERLNVPIGKPVTNYTVFILNSNNKLIPKGAAGELCIGGSGVARGYIGNKDLTNRKFIDNPFKIGEKLYKTGDWARWLPDGNIEFLGRIDNQVKIRGYRIELGEIENQLVTHNLIERAIVLDKGEGVNKVLVAYYLSKERINKSELHAYLSTKLAKYMIPDYFVFLEEIPVTKNGKVDKSSLPDPQLARENGRVAPRNEMELQIVEIWAEVLNLETTNIGVYDNFFDLGGNSIKIIKLTNLINQSFNCNLTVAEIFDKNRISDVVEFIHSGQDNSRVNMEKEIDHSVEERNQFLNLENLLD